jgi:predicted fused transcriptional regulator/phosphomethylpyrimidine kinase
LYKDDIERFYVLGQLVEGVRMLSESSNAYKLLMEVRSNLVMAVDHAQKISEVAGIPGRLTEVFGRITAPAYPAWGASKNTAALLLAIMKFDPSRRALMEIKYSNEILDLIKSNGIRIEKLNTGLPIDENLRSVWAGGKLPGTFYMEGGFSREGSIVITGESAVKVVELVLGIAELLNKEK